MNNYINWLKNCIENIHSIKVDSLSTYFEALGWQLALIGSILIVVIGCAAVIGILLIVPIILLRRESKKYFKEKSKIAEMKAFKLGEINGQPVIYVPNRYERIRQKLIKTIKNVARIVRICLCVLLFLLMPILASMPKTAITVLSITAGFLIAIYMIFTFTDVYQYSNNEFIMLLPRLMYLGWEKSLMDDENIRIRSVIEECIENELKLEDELASSKIDLTYDTSKRDVIAKLETLTTGDRLKEINDETFNKVMQRFFKKHPRPSMNEMLDEKTIEEYKQTFAKIVADFE